MGVPPQRLDIRDRSFRGTVHAAEHGHLWANRGRTLFRRTLDDTKAQGWRPWLTMPLALPRDLFARPRLAERASRADQCVIQPVGPERALVLRAGRAYRVTSDGATALGPIQGDCPLKASVALLPDGSCLFGEYFRNAERGPVHIWRVSPDLAQLELAHRFDAGTVRHVHGVYRDPHVPGAQWITTGDADGECFLWRTDDELRTLERIGDGTQKFRAVFLFFTPDHLIWFTDSNLEQNFMMSMDRRAGTVHRHQPMDSSVWYGVHTLDGVSLCATTIEQGPGVLSASATIHASTDGFTWTAVRRFRKDPWRPMGLFKYGIISFASGQLRSDSVWISGEALWNLDGVSAECSIL